MSLIIYIIKKIYLRIFKKDLQKEILPYRFYLFEELVKQFSKSYFNNTNILEIGPRDGLDTKRLESLNPAKITLIDLPDKEEGNMEWLKDIKTQTEFITANILYMKRNELDNLGKFKLIYCTGVFYHNAEQLKLIKKLYDLLEDDGVLVFESSTIRNLFLRNLNVVQIWYPNTYRMTSTITHLPSKKAILSWLKMVGFREIIISDCFKPRNLNLQKIRFAGFAIKKYEDRPGVYYSKQIKDSDYTLGGSE